MTGSTQRIPWDDLPRPLKEAIEARTGPVTGVRIASAGQNSPLAAIIDARDGKVFAKGLPSAHRRVIAQAREAAVAPLVRGISPALGYGTRLHCRTQAPGQPGWHKPPDRGLPAARAAESGGRRAMRRYTGPTPASRQAGGYGQCVSIYLRELPLITITRAYEGTRSSGWSWPGSY